jgi:hypothetical protein
MTLKGSLFSDGKSLESIRFSFAASQTHGNNGTAHHGRVCIGLACGEAA